MQYEFQRCQPQWVTEAALRDPADEPRPSSRVWRRSNLGRGRITAASCVRERGQEVVRADYLIGAGGGHDLTRHSMQEHLDGETYGGRFIVADEAYFARAAWTGAGLHPEGERFRAAWPPPEGQWLVFVNRDEDDQGAAAAVRGQTRGAGQHPDRNRRRTFRLALDFVLPDAQARCPSQRRQALPVG